MSHQCVSRYRHLVAIFLLHLPLFAQIPQSRLPDSPSTPQPPATLNEQPVQIKALSQEKEGDVFRLKGHAEIHYESFILYADSVTYDSRTGDSHAEGHVVLEGGPSDEHVEAVRADYNIRSQKGRFEIVHGTIGLKIRPRRNLLTTQNPFAFTGKVVLKTTPTHYLVYDGTITTCDLPSPKWYFQAPKVSVEVGGNAKVYRSTFLVKGIPILYLPFATHPVTKEPRQSGFLIPAFGKSSSKGYILGDSAYWAVNRSMDITAGVEYFSLRGWAPDATIRIRPSSTSFVNLKYTGLFDRGLEIGGVLQDQSGQNVKLNAESAFGHNFRGVANIDYLSSYVYRLAFTEVFSQAVNSEVKSLAFLSNNTNGFSYNASVRRYQDFESTTPGDVITILHAPSFETSSVDRRFPLNLDRLPLFWSFDAAVDGLSRSEPHSLSQPGFRTAPLVGRFHLSPGVSLPIQFAGWSIRPELVVRDTSYTQELTITHAGPVDQRLAVDDSINAKALETNVDIRPPALQNIFATEVLHRRWKHVIEPRISYRYVTGINNFSHILRFDDRDIYSDTNEVEYGMVNRLYAKNVGSEVQNCLTNSDSGEDDAPDYDPQDNLTRMPHSEPAHPDPCVAASSSLDVVTWELAQKYYIDTHFGGALVPGFAANVFTSTTDLTGIAFLTDARRFSPIISRLKIQTSTTNNLEWNLDYDFKKGRINTSNLFVNHRFGLFSIGIGDALLQAPGQSLTNAPLRFHQFRNQFTYGGANRLGFSGGASIGFDIEQGFLQYASAQTAYNWDCCGFSLEFRRFALGSVRNENQYRFNFSLANIGSFGTIRRRERLF